MAKKGLKKSKRRKFMCKIKYFAKNLRKQRLIAATDRWERDSKKIFMVNSLHEKKCPTGEESQMNLL